MNNDNNEYVNKNYQDYSDNNNYEEKPKYENIWWKIGGGILVLLLIIVTIVTTSKRGKSSETRYEELKSKLCVAAEEYASSNHEFIDTSIPGITKTIKIEKLADENLVETLIENPYYSENKKNETRYYSLDNSVRLMTLTNGKFYCEMVDTSKDVTAPELRLLGDSIITLAVGTEYEDPGYTATDDYDGDITANVVRSGNVKTDTIGEYKITYTISDSAGNVTTKTRKIIIKNLPDLDYSLGTISDNTVPMISLKGSNPYCIIKGTKYVEPGAVANDNVDGNITKNIVTKNEVTGNVLGAFRITYSVEDSSGNEAIVYRAVTVSSVCPEITNSELIANTTPVITLTGQTSLVIQKDTQYIDLGATAYDKEDGDLTNKIVTDSSLLNTKASGIYKVYYRITDSKGIVANAVRIVIVKGLNEPDTSVMFTTEKNNVSVLVGKGNDNLIDPPKAINQEGYKVNVTKKIEDYYTKSEVDSIDWNKTGKYRVIYTADNNSIVQPKTIVVTVMEGTIEIGGSSQINVTKRNDNCGVTQEDLTKGGVTFDTINNQLPVISIDYGSASVCKVGSYDVKVTATTTDNKTYNKTVKVTVVDGTSTINTSVPTKVNVTYNSAFNTDKYNSNKKWVGGTVSGITINFSSTISGTSIAYYQYSDNCDEVIGNANKTSDNEGTLTWTNPGANSICIRAVTTNGIVGAWSNPINLYIDRTGPKTTFTHSWASGYNDWYNTPNLTINYTATDPESGLDHFEYTHDDVMGLYGEKITNPQKFSEASGSLTLNETTQSSKPRLFVYVRAVDKAGNPGEWTANPAFANIDTLKPNVPTLSIIDNSTSLVKVKATFTDATPTNVNALRISGFGKLIYKLDNGQETIENTDTISLQSLTKITQKVSVWSVDKAGNRSDNFSQTEVTVLPPKLLAKSLFLANNSINIDDGAQCSTSKVYIGNSFKLTATPEPLNADEKVVTWGSNNPNVATVDYDGTIKILSKGTVTISAKIGNASKSCIIDASYIQTNSSFTVKNYDGINYYLYLPKNLTVNMPIIVYLHGSGEMGSDPELIKRRGLPFAISQGTDFNAIVISPQCPSGSRWTTSDKLQRQVAAIINKTVSDYTADSNRISITGHSIGGNGVYGMIQSYPKLFSSGVPVSAVTSAVSTSFFPDTPIWIFVGGEEKIYIPYAQAIYSSFRKHRIPSNYHLNIVPGKDHKAIVGNEGYNIYTDPTYNIVDWMTSQTNKK